MAMVFELLAALALGFLVGRVWEIRQGLLREQFYRQRVVNRQDRVNAFYDFDRNVT